MAGFHASDLVFPDNKGRGDEKCFLTLRSRWARRFIKLHHGPFGWDGTSDDDLIERIASNDKLAMQVLYARHHVSNT